MFKYKYYKYLSCFLILTFFCTTIFFYVLYHKESEKLKNSLIPTMQNDYYTQQLFITKSFIDSEKEIEIDMRKIIYQDSLITNSEAETVSNKKILDVKRIAQNPKYPNGCEAASATMLLNYYHIDISLDEFINKYLPKKEVYEENGVRYGPDPSRYYAGDPSDLKRGWGTFAPVIQTSLETIISDYTPKKDSKYYQTNYQLDELIHVMNLTNYPIGDLIHHLPVVIWVTTDYSTTTEVYNWFDSETNQLYTYPKYSHTVLLVGYDDRYYYINDPLKPDEIIKIKKKQLEDSYNSSGRQALALEEIISEDFWNDNLQE